MDNLQAILISVFSALAVGGVMAALNVWANNKLYKEKLENMNKKIDELKLILMKNDELNDQLNNRMCIVEYRVQGLENNRGASVCNHT